MCGTGNASDRLNDQWNRKESPEINPHEYSQLIFGKGAKEISGEMIPLFTNGAGINKCPDVKVKLYVSCTIPPSTKIN